jgi:hypothetical protein
VPTGSGAADDLDIRRSPKPHLGFGAGIIRLVGRRRLRH